MPIEFFQDKFVNLDLRYSGDWPPFIQALSCVMIVVITLIFGYVFIFNTQLSKLSHGSVTEVGLRQDYQVKYHLAYHLYAYEQQINALERQLQYMTKHLPLRYDIPAMLEDITSIAISAGLSISTLRWGNELQRDIYTELPVYIDLVGDYHQFGRFVSDMTNLSSIVCLYEFEITRQSSALLKIHLVAKTYRYNIK